MTDESPEAWGQDRMSRGGVARFLTNYLDTSPKLKVLNINSPWGTGKTFFLQNWMLEQKSVRVCIYFNAWERDYSGDAFISLVSAIREQLIDAVGTKLKATNLFVDYTKKAARVLAVAAPALVKGAIKKASGLDVKEINDVIGIDELSEAGEKAVEKLIASSKKNLEVVNEFREVFKELLNRAAQEVGEEPKPVYIFIDELDRCRPTFSIELLERVKHFFDIADCKFILATDTEQLAHSVNAIYGAGFDSRRYLKRFFDREFVLDNSDKSAWIKENFKLSDKKPVSATGHTTALSDRTMGMRVTPVPTEANTVLAGKHDLDGHQVVFWALEQTFDTELRQLERIVEQVHAIHANTTGQEFYLFWALYLIFLKDRAPELYEMALHGDYMEALRQITARFRAKSLYMITSVTSVHAVFGCWLQKYREGPDSARRILARSEHEPRYMEIATQAFYVDFESIASYPKQVNLAHSLE